MPLRTTASKESVMNWMGELMSVRDLMQQKLLPIAYAGLEKCGVDQNDIIHICASPHLDLAAAREMVERQSGDHGN